MHFEAAPNVIGIASLEPNTAAIGLGAFAIAALVLYALERDMALFAAAAAILGGFLLT